MISFHCESITLKCEEACYTASLGIVHAPFCVLLEKVNCFLHPYELAYYKNLKYEKKQHSYLLGRYAGKHTLQHYFPNNHLESVFISPGVFHFPVVRGLSENVQISLTHTQPLSAALIFPEEHPMGIDLELIDQEQTTAIQSQLTPHELSLFEKR